MTVIKKYSMFGNCTAENANQYYFLLINLIDSIFNESTISKKGLHRVKSSLLSLELSFRSLLQGRQTSK